MNRGAWIVVGAQWGDEGKGLIDAYLSVRENSKLVCRAGTGANAEHGIFMQNETTYLKANQLPLGWIFNPETQIRIGSGVAVDPVKLFAEMDRYNLRERVKIDRHCPIITPEHIQAEYDSKDMNNIGSTMSGTGYCRADLALRKVQQAKDIEVLQEFLTEVSGEINQGSKEGVVMIESSQGTFLSLSIGDYPNVTSDNVTAMAAADDVLLNWQNLKEVVLVVKALPSREGAGNMGDVPELQYDQLDSMGFAEPSSIYGKTRRKASGIDFEQLLYAVEVNGATQIALTFCEHYDININNTTNANQITPKIHHLIDKIEMLTNLPITILNTGKSYDSIIDRTGGIIDWETIEKNLARFI